MSLMQLVIFLVMVGCFVLAAYYWYLTKWKCQDKYLTGAVLLFISAAAAVLIHFWFHAVLAAVMILLLAALRWLSKPPK